MQHVVRVRTTASEEPLSTVPLSPVVCLRCLYPLDARVRVSASGPMAGLRHPLEVEADHEADPGYASACACCYESGPVWFIAYASKPDLSARPIGAAVLCATCRDLLADGEVDSVVDRALCALDASADAQLRDAERQRLTKNLNWLLAHRLGPAKTAPELVVDCAFGRPG